MGPSRTFAFGIFKVYEGREAYNLQSAEISQYFEELVLDMEGACYGQYFLEFGDYYSRENMDGSSMLLLIYQSLRALLNQSIPNALVRRIFELKMMVINGEYMEHPPKKVSESANYAWEFVICCPLERLYTFALTEAVFQEFAGCVEMNMERYVDRKFHSLEILQALFLAGT